MVAVSFKAAAALLLGAHGAAAKLADIPRTGAMPVVTAAAPMPLAAGEMSVAAPTVMSAEEHLAASVGAGKLKAGFPSSAVLPPALGGIPPIPSLAEHRRMEALDAVKEKPRAIRTPLHKESPVRDQEKAIRSLSTNLQRYHAEAQELTALAAARDAALNKTATAAHFFEAASADLRDCREKRLELATQEMDSNTVPSAKNPLRASLKSAMTAVTAAERRFEIAKNAKSKTDLAVQRAEVKLQVVLKKLSYYKHRVKDSGHDVGIAANAISKLQGHHAREVEAADTVAAALEKQRAELGAAIDEATTGDSKA